MHKFVGVLDKCVEKETTVNVVTVINELFPPLLPNTTSVMREQFS